jgi:hypothetical protein
MSGHTERLAGLAVLSAVIGDARSVHVRADDVDPALWASGRHLLVDRPGGDTAAVIVADGVDDAAAKLDAVAAEVGETNTLRGPVWVLWRGQRARAVEDAAARARLAVHAAFRCTASPSAPVHLVREGPGGATRWFGAAVRERWGWRSRIGALANQVPAIGQRFFEGRALLLAPPEDTLRWPGAVTAGSTPAVLHLASGTSSGRAVLTWADESGTPLAHTKVGLSDHSAGLSVEAHTLTVLATMGGLEGSVPRLAQWQEAAHWLTLTQSHLAGRAIHPPAPGTPGAATALHDLDAQVSAWVRELALASRSVALGELPAPDPSVAATVAGDFDDPGLAEAVLRGLVVAKERPSVLHGDLWRGNVLQAPDGASLRVIDWESARVGHPVFDLLTWVVTQRSSGGPVGPAFTEALTVEGDGAVTAERVASLLAAIDQELDADDVEALVLAQLVLIALEGGPATPSEARQREWLAAVESVWQAWQRDGSPWRPAAMGQVRA